MSGSAPQPSAAIDQLFQTVFTVVKMAVSAMRLMPWGSCFGDHDKRFDGGGD